MSTTVTITNGFRDNQDIIVANDQSDWTQRPSTWADWTSWAINPNNLTVRIDIDTGTNTFRTPLIRPFLEGDATIQLKTSPTGGFSGEETTIDFVTSTTYSYSKARYYRWTIAITPNATFATPRLLGYITNFDSDYIEEYFDDLDLGSLSQDALGNRIVTPSVVTTVNHVQGTAHQGGLYVVEDYIIPFQTPDSGLTRDPKTISNTGSENQVTINTGLYKFDSGGAMQWTDSDVDTFASGVLSWPKSEGNFPWHTDSTIDFWFYNTNAFGANKTYKIYLDGENSTSPQFHFVTDGSGEISYIRYQVQYYDGLGYSTASVDTSATALFGSAGWYHVALETEFTGTNPALTPGSWTNYLYVNGTLRDSNGAATGISGAYPSEPTSTTYQFGSFGEEMIPATFEEIRWTTALQYNGANFTVPGSQYGIDADTFVLLHGNSAPIADDNGDDYGTDPYIEDQKGGAVVIQTKNPLTIKVVDYQGNDWDGTVDLMLRGLGSIEMQDDYSVTKS